VPVALGRLRVQSLDKCLGLMLCWPLRRMENGFSPPLFVALVLVELTDLIFAVDSIPAVFAITADPFLVFTSNVFAILGLRSLYFSLAGLIHKFQYLKPALSLILVLVGAKMLAAKWLKVWLGDSFNLVVLTVIIAILITGVLTSILLAERKDDADSDHQS
jgi:tellurite resistance protein TerC